MTHRFNPTAALIAGVTAWLWVDAALAQQKPFEGEINTCRTIAEEVNSFFREIDGAQGENTVLFTPDLPLAKKWHEELAARYEAIAQLFEQGKEQEARAAWAAADPIRERRWRWRERLERRMRQQDSAPNEWWYSDNRRWLFRGGEGYVNTWCEARKAASEAWGKLADLTTPEQTDLDLQPAVTAAINAQLESSIAEQRMYFHRELHEVIANRTLTPEVDAKLKMLQETFDQQLETARQRELIEQKTRLLDQRRRAQQDDLRRVYDRAKREAEETARAAKEAKRQAEEAARAERAARRAAEEEARRAREQK